MASSKATMHAVHGRYGKTKVRVMRVQRHTEFNHDICEVDVECLLEGDLETSYTIGDNSLVVPTDTVKNTCYVIAKTSNFRSIEDYGIALVRYFLSRHRHLNRVTVTLEEKLWSRHSNEGVPHDHVFVFPGDERRTAQVIGECRDRLMSNVEISVKSGLKGLKVLKTTQSGFVGYVVDEFTSLKPVGDRIFCTNVEAEWTFDSPPPQKYRDVAIEIRTLMMKVFGGPSKGGEFSKSVQETMYKMGIAALEAFPQLGKVKLVLPNIHHFLYDLERFGIENKGEIFYPTDDPSGLIECTIFRRDVATQRSRL